MNKFDFSRNTASNRQEFTALNLEKLKALLSYFSQLRANEEISDRAFETLVSHACSIFIENQVEIVVQKTLEQKLMTFLHSKFTA